MARRLIQEDVDLDALIANAADWKGWNSTFVQQDFYIVEVLRALASSDVKDEYYFKGGTSLTKCYDCIRRFSEDVDILIVPSEDLSEGQIDRMLKSVTLRVGHHLGIGEASIKRIASKRGANRDSQLDVGSGLRLEMGLVGEPVPATVFTVRSIVSEFIEAEQIDEATEYLEFDPILVRTQSATRTTVEKLAAIHTTAVAVEEDRMNDAGIARKLQTFGKHLYDVHHLLQLADVLADLRTSGTTAAELAERVERVSSKWEMASHPRPDGGYAASPAFDPNGKARTQLHNSYQQIEPLVFGEFPAFEDCLSTVSRNSLVL